MVKINIQFNKPSRKYRPGDAIDLNVGIQNSSTEKYRSIYVRIRGFSHVEWTESKTVDRNGKKYKEHTTYSSHQSFFEYYQTLAGEKSGTKSDVTDALYD